jgi:hypothetical protein
MSQHNSELWSSSWANQTIVDFNHVSIVDSEPELHSPDCLGCRIFCPDHQDLNVENQSEILSVDVSSQNSFVDIDNQLNRAEFNLPSYSFDNSVIIINKLKCVIF